MAKNKTLDEEKKYQQSFYIARIWGAFLATWLLNLSILILGEIGTGYYWNDKYHFGYIIMLVIMSAITLITNIIKNRAHYSYMLFRAKKHLTQNATASIDSRAPIAFSLLLFCLQEIALIIFFSWCGSTASLPEVQPIVIITIVVLLVIELIHIIRILELSEYPNKVKNNKLKEINWGFYIGAEIVFGVGLSVFFAIIIGMNIAYGDSKDLNTLFIFGIMFAVAVTVIRVGFLTMQRSKAINIQVAEWKARELLKKQKSEQQNHQSANVPLSFPSALNKQTAKSDQDIINNLMKKGQSSRKAVESIAELYHDFLQYSQSQGLIIEDETAKELIAAMAASRGLWLQCEDEKYAEQIAAMLNNFFTGCYTTIEGNIESTKELFRNVLSAEKCTVLLERLYRANIHTDCVHIIAFEGVSSKNFSMLFKEFLAAIQAPEDDNMVKADYTSRQADNAYLKQAHLKLPANLWYIFIGNNESSLPLECREYLSEVHLKPNGEFSQVSIKENKEAVPSYVSFSEALREALQTSYLSLDAWKKLDKIEEYLCATTNFAITNSLARQIEQYVSVLLACEVEVSTVLDRVLAGYVLPMLSGYTKEEIEQKGSGLEELLDGLFGIDNLPISHKILMEKGLC